MKTLIDSTTVVKVCGTHDHPYEVIVLLVKALVKLYLVLALTVKDLPSLAVSSSRDEWINELSRLDQCYEVSY